MPSMTLGERRSGGVTILDLRGRLVLEEGVSVLRESVDRLLAAGQVDLLINMRDVTYVDSCGVGVLIAKLVSARRQGGDVRLLHLTPRSHRVLDITKLLDVFQTFDSEPAAVASFASRS